MRLHSDRRRLVLDGLAVAAATAALWYVLGGVGVALAAAVAVVLVVVSAVYAFAVGQLLFVLLATEVLGDVPVEGLLVAQVGLAALLLAALVGHWPRRAAALAGVAFAVAAATRARYRRSALAMGLVGLLALGGAALLPDVRTVLLALGGTSVFAAILTFYLTPERFVAASVGEAVYATLADNEAAVVADLDLRGEPRVVPGRGPAAPARLFVPLDAGVPSLTLNHGTAVEPNGATVLVASSEYSYLDRDDSGAPDGDEVVRSHPVATVESVGEGRVVVVGDPSVFINAMQGRAGNEAFTRSLVADADQAVVDASRTSLPPLVAAVLTVRDSVLLQGILGLGGLVAVAATGRLLGRRRDRPDDAVAVDDDAVAAGLRRRYPAIDPARLRKVTEGVIRNRAERGDNE